ncbi:MAG: hypothetical protein ICV83_32670 [Cytophagales bacterium]|nr:hypothetical protein [Cytophagales bacterium]
MLVRLGCRLFSLYVLIRNAQAEERDGYAVIGTGGRLPTCSFFRWLFWNDRQTLTEGEQAQVLRHELTHIRQWHSLDLLLAEGVVVLLWFNPFAYWFRQQLQTLHEHLADREAARLYSQSAYLELLVSQALPPVKFSLVHPFGQSLLHTRVAMVRKGSHHRPARWKMTVSVAGVVLTSLAYACTEQKNVAPDGPGLLRTLAEADAQMVVFKQKYPRLRLGGFVETRYQDGRRVTAFGVTVEGVANATDQAKIKSLVAQQTAAVLESGRMEGDTAPYVLVDKPLPNVTVTGTVYAEDDHVPLAGCVAGSVVTGKNGRFQTNFRSGDTLTFTRVGYYTHKIPVRGQDGEQIRLSVRLRRNPTVAPERLARAEAAIAAEVARE